MNKPTNKKRACKDCDDMKRAAGEFAHAFKSWVQKMGKRKMHSSKKTA